MTKHNWSSEEVIGYTPPMPRPIGTGFKTPIIKMTCTECGKVVAGDKGSTKLDSELLEETCP
jgi:hypothetical protein